MTMIKNFLAAEDGAVTVDWVVLTAALVGLGLAVLAVVSDGVNTLSNNIADDLAAIDPETENSTIITRAPAAAAP
ncbi:MAG: hypothetical protein AAFN09_08805 [Pseudomonadota bacterium]